jgi:hypothetical protein
MKKNYFIRMAFMMLFSCQNDQEVNEANNESSEVASQEVLAAH